MTHPSPAMAANSECWTWPIAECIARDGAVVRVTVVRAEGSTPREIGAAMLVSAGAIRDTIGGGALEHEAIAHARTIIAGAGGDAPWYRELRPFALGPSLGQCCGGAVLLMFERFSEHERPALEEISRTAEPRRAVVLRPTLSGVPLQVVYKSRTEDAWPSSVIRILRVWNKDTSARGARLFPGRKDEPDWWLEPLATSDLPLVLYGAGHVGRALVRALEGLPFRITWMDERPAAFPDGIAPQVIVQNQPVDPALLMRTLPANAIHIVMTHSHPLDLAICHAVLQQDDFRFLGLIGSATKRARFLKRLRELGIAEAQLGRLVCPIGLPGIADKRPAAIAVATAAQLLQIASG